MHPKRLSGRSSSRLEPGLSLDYLGTVDMRHSGNEWRAAIPIAGFDFRDISVGSGTRDLGLDVDFLTQRLGEPR